MLPFDSNNEDSICHSFSDKIKGLGGQHLFCYSYGSILSQDALLDHHFDSYHQFFLSLLKDHNSDYDIIKPAGTYLILYWKGNWDTLPEAYEQIMNLYGHRSDCELMKLH